MRQPLETIYVTGQFKEKAQPGTGLKDSAGVARHIGTDLRASVGTPVYAPGAGVVTSAHSGSAGQVLEVRIAGKLWRFMHLSQFRVSAGQSFTEGQEIARSGNSGGVAPHLHVDVRKDGTTWNASLSNYYNYQDVINGANKPAPAPSTGKRLYFEPIKQTATFFPLKGGEFKMYIKDASYNWNILATEPRRVKVTSASAGGECWVYLIDKNGKTIPGRYVK